MLCLLTLTRVGGHLFIADASRAIEEFMNKIEPTESARKTPPIEPWFSPEDLQVVSAEETLEMLSMDHDSSNQTRPFHSAENTIQVLSAVEREIVTAHETVDRDCSQLLRKAQLTLAKCQAQSKANEAPAGGAKE